MEFMTSLQSGLDEQKPSLFELLSEQQLGSLIPPSLRYLLAVATHRHPRYLLRILNSFDEVYALLSLVVERYYLRTYGGGFTENFYGLKRERVLAVRNGEVPRAALGAPEQVRESLRLKSADVWKNLAVMVGLPYIKRKLDESYDIHAAHANLLGPQFQNRDELGSNPSVKQRILHYYKWFLRNIYPSVNAAFYFSLLAFNLAYLFDGTKYHSPFLWLIGTRMRRMNSADHKAIELATNPPAPSPQAGVRPGQTRSIFSPRTLTQTVYPRLLSSLKILLPTSIFALKFLEWWHASDFARQLSRKAAEGLELPAPTISGLPPIPKASRLPTEKSGVTFSTDEKATPSPQSPPERDSSADTEKSSASNSFRNPPISSTTLMPILTVPPAYSSELCPICLASIMTPTASPSGYVYCYTCIFRWVEGTHSRQEQFMAGNSLGSSAEGLDERAAWENGEAETGAEEDVGGSRLGRWESGQGRDAVTGRRILGGSGALRRVMV
ncbi:Peroxisome bioproteinsis factor 10 [Sphaceloma murrayae]|uniref:Peroxisome assembly protein 12 n=1 Tax=Sphaceloma murrayae TaxID=2082308 RepID=A0A2K1QTK4_9PEZI|nr:Peroxisome bioproteinsis factor 10 [Sphaceloma murrayae]